MPWVRLEDLFPEHPKILGLSDAAFRLHVRALCYAARNLTDGAIPRAWVGRGEGKAVVPLVTAGIWIETDRGYQIHDYLQYQPSRDQVGVQRMQLAQVRADAGRRGGLAKVANRLANSLANQQQQPTGVATNLPPSNSSKRVAPSPPIPEEILKQSDPTTTRSQSQTRSSSPLVTSPLTYEKAKEKFAFYGSRLRVPHVLHDELRTKLGGREPHQKLLAWYEALNAEIDQSLEAIVDVFDWLRPRFKEWAGDTVANAELEKFRPKGA